MSQVPSGTRLRGPEWHVCGCSHRRNLHWTQSGCDECACTEYTDKVDTPEGWEHVGWALPRGGPPGITYGWRLTDTKQVESGRWRPVFIQKETL